MYQEYLWVDKTQDTFVKKKRSVIKLNNQNILFENF